MSKKHQHIISKKSTRSKAQRSWRRKAKLTLLPSGRARHKRRLPKLRKVPKKGIPQEKEIKIDPICTIADIVDQKKLKKLIDNMKEKEND